MQPLPLHTAHEKLKAHFGQKGDRELVLSYGSVDSEYRAAHSAVGLHDASFRQFLQATGEDRVSFLHGMVTNDVKGLAENNTTYAALLTAKGAMVADARLWRRADDILVEVEPGLLSKVKGFLDSYLISEDVELRDASGDFAFLWLLGPKASAAAAPFAAGVAEGQFSPADALASGALALRAEWPLSGICFLVPHASAQQAWDALAAATAAQGGLPVGFEALEVLRVEAGVPRYGADMDDKTIPLEAGLTRALHYNKGCYIGQEVIARATYRGHMNRKLSAFLLGAASPAPGTELRSAGKRVGWLTTVLHSYAAGQNVALGYVQTQHQAPGTSLELAGGGGQAQVAPLPLSQNLLAT